jgi:hypothetical protein
MKSLGCDLRIIIKSKSSKLKDQYYTEEIVFDEVIFEGELDDYSSQPFCKALIKSLSLARTN